MMKPKTITITLSVLAVLFFASYAYFASTMASLGYELDNRQDQLEKLYEARGELTVELADRQSPGYLSNQREALGLVEIESGSDYLDTRVSSLGRANETN